MKMDDIDFSGFTKRKERLDMIGRFHIYEPMLYRPSVYFHSRKVFHLIKESLPIILSAFPDFHSERALIMALVHDDAEMVIGDFQAGNKAKLTEEQKDALKEKEVKAIHDLADSYPDEIMGFSYRELLLEVSEMNTIESQVVKYLDRFDAFGEALHELFAGNEVFAKNITTEYGKVELPTDYYTKRFNEHENIYSMITKLMDIDKIPFLKECPKPDIQEILKISEPHTIKSIQENKPYLPYDWWLKTLVKRLDEEDLKNLYVRKE